MWHSACGADHRSIALEDLGDELKTLVCKSYFGCGQYPDEATCRAQAAFDIEQLKASVKAGRIRYDGVEAATCLDAAAGNLCEVSTGSSQSTKACDRPLINPYDHLSNHPFFGPSIRSSVVFIS
ncbi:MAG: hypothetical protein ABI560_06165, partial [Myxococcales bacterium]